MANVESKLLFNTNRACDECFFMQELIKSNKKDKFKNTSLEKLNEYRTKCANCKKGQLKFDAIAYSMLLSKEKEENISIIDEEKKSINIIKNRNEGKHFKMSDFELKSLFELKKQGFTYQEIADKMNMSYTKIYNTYNLNFSEKTKEKVQKRLKDLGIDFSNEK